MLYFFPPFVVMGQYFKAVNTTKRECVCPWCIGGFAKLLEWAANPYGAIFTLLLRKSSEVGCADCSGPTYETDRSAIAGRWAGDSVVLVGDYDDSRLWDSLPAYRNISEDVAKAWNELFIGRPERQLTFELCRHCSEEQRKMKRRAASKQEQR